MSFGARLRYWRAMFGPFGLTVTSVYGFLVLLTWVRDNFLAPATRLRWDTYGLIPHWSLAWWIALGLGVLLVAAHEGSYRLDSKRGHDIAALQRDLHDALAPKRIVEPFFLALTQVSHYEDNRKRGFALNIEILYRAAAPTSFEPMWNLDVVKSNGEQIEGVKGKLWSGTQPLTQGLQTSVAIVFPYSHLLPDIDALVGARLTLSNVDIHTRPARGKGFVLPRTDGSTAPIRAFPD